jgi:hypothetical protein
MAGETSTRETTRTNTNYTGVILFDFVIVLIR